LIAWQRLKFDELIAQQSRAALARATRRRVARRYFMLTD
jgi:hypothetical protein